MFFKTYQGYKLDERFLQKYGFDEFLHIPFTLENKNIQLPENLKTSLIACISKTKVNEVHEPDTCFDEFVSLVQLYKQFFSAQYQPTSSVNDQILA